jgi:deoxyadenosine/deoxycytidine kinase
MFIVTVTGPIGVGKTTVLNELRCLAASHTEFAWIFYTEPVDVWQAEGWLADFNTEPARTALGFQMKVLLGQDDAGRKWAELERVSHRPLIVVTERSPVDGCKIFMPLSPTAAREQALVEALGARLWVPHLNVLLDCSKGTAQQRRTNRNRDEPGHEYAERVHDRYLNCKPLFDCVVQNEGKPSMQAAEEVLQKIMLVV